MKKIYKAPELELVKIILHDVILESVTENPISSQIGGGGAGDDLDNLDDLP